MTVVKLMEAVRAWHQSPSAWMSQYFVTYGSEVSVGVPQSDLCLVYSMWMSPHMEQRTCFKVNMQPAQLQPHLAI